MTASLLDFALVAPFGPHPDIIDTIEAEEIRRRDHGFKRDRSTIPCTERREAATRPWVDESKEEEGEGDDDDSGGVDDDKT